MEFRLVLARTYRAGQIRLACGPHEAARLRQSGIHSARMKSWASACLLAGLALGGCAYTPPTLTSLLDVRRAPYTPDSGSIAIRCGRLIDGIAETARRNVLVVIRDGRITAVKPDAKPAEAVATHFPILDLTG